MFVFGGQVFSGGWDLRCWEKFLEVYYHATKNDLSQGLLLKQLESNIIIKASKHDSQQDYGPSQNGDTELLKLK